MDGVLSWLRETSWFKSASNADVRETVLYHVWQSWEDWVTGNYATIGAALAARKQACIDQLEHAELHIGAGAELFERLAFVLRYDSGIDFSNNSR